MILIVAGTVFLAICAISLWGGRKSGDAVRRLLADLAENPPEPKGQEKETASPALPNSTASLDTFSEIEFTRSLLALSKVRSLDPCGSRAPWFAESSLSELPHLVQSKTRDQVL